MFDLDREVTAWSASVYADRCQSGAGVAELNDHLHCEIERVRAAGVSDEDAFRIAVARLGSAAQLTSEQAKNRSALGTVCQLAARLDGNVTSEQRSYLLMHAVVWASLIFATSLLMTRNGAPKTAEWLITGMFVPMWWASEQLLRRALRKS